jgi:hypothetical protein
MGPKFDCLVQLAFPQLLTHFRKMYDLSPLEAAASLIIIKIKKHNQDLEYLKIPNNKNTLSISICIAMMM